jgi:hypothetical protein
MLLTNYKIKCDTNGVTVELNNINMVKKHGMFFSTSYINSSYSFFMTVFSVEKNHSL